MEYSLVHSLPPASFEILENVCAVLKGITPGFQIDIVDGVFAPSVSWPFAEPSPQEALRKIKQFTTDFEIEVDCMIMYPEKYLSLFVELGVKRVIVHIGSTDAYSAIVKHAKEHGYKIGFAFTNDVPLSFIYPYIGKIDFVQVMGITQVGRQGEPFDTRTLTTVTTLREQYPELEIAVDGGVNAQTIPKLLEVGVNRFAPGSAIAQAENPADAYKQLLSLMRK